MSVREYFVLVAAQVGTLFLLMAVGYTLARLGRFGHETQAQATTLLLYVVTPCLIVDTLQLSPSPELMRSMGQCLALTLALTLGFALLMGLFFRRQEPDTRAVLRFGAAYGNVGFMGLPLIQGVLGEAGLIFAIVGQVVFNLLGWSHGVLAMGDRGRFSPRKMVLNPGILGSAVGLALFLLGYEFFSITMSFSRRRFAQIAVCLTALSLLYLLYCGQDPGQVYRFYSYDYIWIRGVGYLQHELSIRGYFVLVVVNVICGVLGLGSLLRYTRDSFASDRNDVALERKFDIARTGASVFVHSIKNQLLANRVLHKRIRAELEQEAPDLERVRGWADSLCENNEQLISRSEELYRTVKAKSVRLVPTSLERLAELSASRFLRKYPEGRLLVEVEPHTQVLADENYLSEAIYNLLTNGWESNLLAGNPNCAVSLYSHMERLYTVLEVRDHGTGIPRAALKHIFEPFYSSKNSNYNWGMGLYHVQAIVRSHLGSLRVENHAGDGASFYLLLPRYDQRNAERRRQP